MTENKSDSRPNQHPDKTAPASTGLPGDDIEPFLTLLGQRSQALGLNLFHAWSASELRASGLGWMPDVARDTDNAGLLLMFGNAGSSFWQHFQRYSEKSLSKEDAEQLVSMMLEGELGNNPIDTFAAEQTALAIDSAWAGLDSPSSGVGNQEAPLIHFIYPSNVAVDSASDSSAAPVDHPPLQRLGELAGWHQPSPLGTGINPRWGLWYAYRALVWLPTESTGVKVAMAASARQETASLQIADTAVCASCQSQACVSVCPSSALTFSQSPDMTACADYRMQSDSACSDRCLAREACPVNADEPYPREQISYHYRKALTGLIKYFAELKV